MRELNTERAKSAVYLFTIVDTWPPVLGRSSLVLKCSQNKISLAVKNLRIQLNSIVGSRYQNVVNTEWKGPLKLSFGILNWWSRQRLVILHLKHYLKSLLISLECTHQWIPLKLNYQTAETSEKADLRRCITRRPLFCLHWRIIESPGEILVNLCCWMNSTPPTETKPSNEDKVGIGTEWIAVTVVSFYRINTENNLLTKY